MVSKAIDLGLRGFEVRTEIKPSLLQDQFKSLTRTSKFLWTLLVLALVGGIIADATGGNPSIINYDMFVAVLSMLSLFFLITSAFFGIMAGTPIPLALDGLNTLFFFCGAVAMSAQLGVHSCSNEVRSPVSFSIPTNPLLPPPDINADLTSSQFCQL
jgi:Membrane-associating domain